MSEKAVYIIRLKGILDARWSGWFAPLVPSSHRDETRLVGPIQDQAELFGVLLKIRDMGLQLIAVNLISTLKSEYTFPALVTERLLLREFNLEDVPAVYDILSREDVNQWLETDTIRSLEEAEARVRSRIGLFRDQMGFRWAITLQQSPSQVIGSCGFFSVRRGTQTVESGYELHPDYWSKGIMTEALQAMIQFGFSDQDLFPVHRIEALVVPGNVASLRLLEKLGFEREGVRREFGFWKGRYQDVALYALLNTKKG